jgi:hypothetical protein
MLNGKLHGSQNHSYRKASFSPIKKKYFTQSRTKKIEIFFLPQQRNSNNFKLFERYH